VRTRTGLIALILIMLFIGMTLQSHRVNATEPTLLKVVNPLTGDQWFNFTSPWKKVGDTFTLNITVTNVVNMGAWEVELQLNSSVLEFVKLIFPSDNVFAGENPQTPLVITKPVASVGMVIFGAAAGPMQPSFSGSGVLAQVELKILQGIGESDLSFGDIGEYGTYLTALDLSNITFTPVNGYYHSSENPMCADINNDGTVDMKDLMSAVQMFNSFPDTPRWNPRADIDGNGRIDMRDIVIIVLNFGKHA
jgi:hypothetical protein